MMYIRILTILILLFSFSSDSFAGLKMPSALKDKLPGGDKGGSSETIDFSSMKTGLTDAFFKSADKFLEAQGYLFKAYKMDGAAKEINALRKRAKDGKIDENERMDAVIRASAQNSEELKKIMEKESVTNAEQKAMYGKSFKPMGEGVKYAIQMGKEMRKMQKSISEDKMNAIKQLGGFIKVIKNLPGYMNTVQSTASMAMSGAKANDIEVSKKMRKLWAMNLIKAIRKVFFVVFLLCLTSADSFSEVKFKSVEATGSGTSREEAINNALAEAISIVNGKSIQIQTIIKVMQGKITEEKQWNDSLKALDKESVSKINDASKFMKSAAPIKEQEFNREYVKEMIDKVNGGIKSYKIIKQKKKRNLHHITIKAEVAFF